MCNKPEDEKAVEIIQKYLMVPRPHQAVKTAQFTWEIQRPPVYITYQYVPPEMEQNSKTGQVRQVAPEEHHLSYGVRKGARFVAIPDDSTGDHWKGIQLTLDRLEEEHAELMKDKAKVDSFLNELAAVRTQEDLDWVSNLLAEELDLEVSPS